MESSEVWKPVPCYAHLGVEASSQGRIRKGERILAQHISHTGYPGVYICFDGAKRTHKASRLVCMAFHGEPPTSAYHAAHINGIKTDNRPENLAWRSPRDNHADRRIHGTMGKKLTLDTAKQIVAAFRSGERVAAIAERFRISDKAVSNISLGRMWPDAGGHPGLARQKRPPRSVNRALLDTYIVAAGRMGSAAKIARELGCRDATVSARRQQLEAAYRAAGRDLWAAASAPAA